ncbi:MAG: oligosaccharide flippase family protein [Clostridiaceae bacterium]|nr:oligosaccharide flippase family protein [Clostridiaceae bacterium]
MRQYRKLGKNMAFITLGNFASKLLSFFMMPLYTAVLTTTEYGIADLMTTTINLLAPFFTLIISEAVMRFALDDNKDSKQVFAIGMTITICGFGIMLVFSPILLLSKNLARYYWFFILYYLMTTIHTLVSQFVKGIEKVDVYSISGVVQTIALIGLNVFFLLGLKIGIIGYLLSLILSNVIAIVFLFIRGKLWKYCISLLKIDRKLLKEMLQYSIPMIPNSLSWWVSNSSDKYMLTLFLGVAVTGVYSVSQRIPSMFAIISTIFIGAWQISAVDDFGSEKSRLFYSNIYKIYSSLNILMVSGFICLSKVLARFLFLNDFFDGWRFVPVLLFAFLFQAMAGYLGTIYTSSKKTKMLFISTVSAAITNIALNALLIPIFNAQGAAIATLLSYLLIWLIRLIDTKKILKLDISFGSDILSYILISIQIWLMISDVLWMQRMAWGLLAVLVWVNRTMVSKMLGMFTKSIRMINRQKRGDR